MEPATAWNEGYRLGGCPPAGHGGAVPWEGRGRAARAGAWGNSRGWLSGTCARPFCARHPAGPCSATPLPISFTFQVVSVDRSVLPYSYGILLGGNYRETEASRLRVAGDGAGNQEVYPQTLIPSGLSHGGVERCCSPEAAVELRTESADFSFGEWTGLEVSTVLVPTEATAMHTGALDAMGPPSAPVAAANHDW